MNIVKNIAFCLIALAGAAYSTEETPKAKKIEKSPLDYSFSYAKIGVVAIESDNAWVVLPNAKASKRIVSGDSGFDISASIAFHEDKLFAYSFPKGLYIRYFEPKDLHSMFIGLGGSFGGVVSHKNQQKREFIGILGNASLGIEFNRGSKFPSILECEIGIPLISALSHSKEWPSPTLAFNYGFGF